MPVALTACLHYCHSRFTQPPAWSVAPPVAALLVGMTMDFHPPCSQKSGGPSHGRETSWDGVRRLAGASLEGHHGGVDLSHTVFSASQRGDRGVTCSSTSGAPLVQRIIFLLAYLMTGVL